MKSKLTSLIFVLTMFFVNSIFAQNERNTSTPLHPKTAQFALEVYQDVSEYQKPNDLALYSQWIYQVTLEDVGSFASAYPMIQVVGLKNKYNPNLTFDQAGFDVTNFNPLKYLLDFYSEEIQKYRVGLTNYVVTITPVENH